MNVYKNAVAVLVLQSIPGIFNKTIKKYYEQDKAQLPDYWIEKNIEKGKITNKFFAAKKNWAAEILDTASSKGIHWYTLWDRGYPLLLKQIHDPPSILFYLGKTPENNLPALSIVGTRKPLSQSIYWTRDIITAFENSKYQIISGLAKGIDTAVHKFSMQKQLKTFAVLGSGLNIIYPKENEKLSREIIATGGGILSEFLPDTPPDKFRFPQRNRIMSGLCQKVILIQAAGRSGALGTCKWALEQNREIWVLAPIFNSEHFGGNVRLISEGANLLAYPNKLIEDDFSSNPGIPALEQLNINDQKILENIPANGIHREELLQLFSFSPGQLELIIFDLMEKGFIFEGKGNFLFQGMPAGINN